MQVNIALYYKAQVIEGIQKVKEFRNLEKYTGLSVEIFPDNEVSTCLINSIGGALP